MIANKMTAKIITGINLIKVVADNKLLINK
jgi:hypothetical protein